MEYKYSWQYDLFVFFFLKRYCFFRENENVSGLGWTLISSFTKTFKKSNILLRYASGKSDFFVKLKKKLYSHGPCANITYKLSVFTKITISLSYSVVICKFSLTLLISRLIANLRKIEMLSKFVMSPLGQRFLHVYFVILYALLWNSCWNILLQYVLYYT